MSADKKSPIQVATTG